MTTVVSDLLGKRVRVVRYKLVMREQHSIEWIGVVRGVAQSDPGSFSLLIEVDTERSARRLLTVNTKEDEITILGEETPR